MYVCCFHLNASYNGSIVYGCTVCMHGLSLYFRKSVIMYCQCKCAAIPVKVRFENSVRLIHIRAYINVPIVYFIYHTPPVFCTVV